jgi:general stress protein 26
MKEYPNSIEFDDIWCHFEGFPLAHVATIDGDQPRVRSMALIAYNKELWLATKTVWDKVSQIETNNRIEFIVEVRTEKGNGTLRCTGTADIIKDEAIRIQLASEIPWFSSYWISPNDENFTLIHLGLNLIRYDHPYDKMKYTVRL